MISTNFLSTLMLLIMPLARLVLTMRSKHDPTMNSLTTSQHKDKFVFGLGFFA